jgi:hypothetical protein
MIDFDGKNEFKWFLNLRKLFCFLVGGYANEFPYNLKFINPLILYFYSREIN